jgi:hypothetical protein
VSTKAKNLPSQQGAYSPWLDKDSMDKAQYNWLVDLHKNGQLLHPDKPAASFAKLAVNGIPKEVIGKVVPWDDPRL